MTTLRRAADETAGRAPDAAKLVSITEAGQRLAREIAEIEAKTLAAEERALDLAEIAKTRHEEAANARLSYSSLTTERETLTKLVMLTHDDGVPPIVDWAQSLAGLRGGARRRTR